MPCLQKKPDDVKPLYTEQKKVDATIKRSRPFDCFEQLQSMKEPSWGNNENHVHK